MFESYNMGRRAGYAGCKINICPLRNPFQRFWYEIGYYEGLRLSLMDRIFRR